MRLLTLLVLTFLAAGAAATEPPADRERQVRVALALAVASQCGECRFDEAGCRAEAEKAGKPLVLFVGGPACSRCGPAVKSAGGIPCVVDSYDGDNLGSKPRAVVLGPKPTGGWWIEATLAGFSEATVKAAVERAKPKPPPPAAPTAPMAVPLNWQI